MQLQIKKLYCRITQGTKTLRITGKDEHIWNFIVLDLVHILIPSVRLLLREKNSTTTDNCQEMKKWKTLTDEHKNNLFLYGNY